jgi:arylsulfatase
MAIYAAMVESIDRNLGRLKKELVRTGQWENTLFLFMSDNGANPRERSGRGHILPWKPKCGMSQGTEWAAVSNTPFRWYKQNNFMGGVATPLIVHWPAGLKAKSWDNTVSHIVDIMPTLLELSGAEYPKTMRGEKVGEMAGISLAPLLVGQKVEREDPIFYSYVGNNGLWNGRYKLVSNRGGPWMLFDMEKDPVENDDIAASHPEIVRTMSEEWYKIGNAKVVHKDSRAPRKETSDPWGQKKGKSKDGEQHPKWGKKPPLPLPNE